MTTEQQALNPLVSVSFKVSKDDKELLDTLAEANERTMPAQLSVLFRKYIKPSLQAELELVDELGAPKPVAQELVQTTLPGIQLDANPQYDGSN